MLPSNAPLETTGNNSSQNSTVTPQPSRVQQRQQQQQQVANNNAAAQGENAEPKHLSLAELFAEDAPDLDDEGNPTQSAADDPSKPPESMEAMSKRLGLKPDQVYNVKIPMPNGAEPLTIGQLKDRVGELVELETREMQFDQRRMKQEGELLRAQAEMREIMAMVPKEHLKPEVVNKVRLRHEQTMRREREQTLELIPDWQDEKRRTEDIQGMQSLLSEYGFDETFLGSVVDHRAVKFIRDSYLRDKRIKAALAKVTVVNSKGQRPSQKTKSATRPNMQSKPKGVADQRSRIMELLAE